MATVKALMKTRKLAEQMKKLTKIKKPEPTKTRKAYKLFVEGDDKELYPLFVDAKNKVPQGEFLEANFPDVAFTAPNGRMYVPSKGAKRGKGEKAKGTGDPVIIPDEKTRKKLIEEGYITDRVKRTEDAPFGKVTAVAARPGWHASQMPVATHIGPQDIKITAKDAETLIQAGITPEAIKKRGNQFYVKRRAEDHVYAEVEMADDVDYQSLLAKEGKTDINDRVPVGGSYKYVDGQADSDKWVVGGDMKVNRVLSKEETKNLQKGLGVKDLPLREEVENILGKKFYQGGSVTGDTMEQGVDDYILAKTDSNKIEMNVGGIAKQMELFEDGGLKDEGGMVDEVSGNDVPTGSTREEVRDDIPAQLSEGEFVLPADVVRYHGLEKIMELRDEAKQGLQKMEAMGQMGNSEEAILPDDVPFDMDDLDIEDDEPQEMEMAEGGYVMVGGKPMPVPTVAGKPLNMQVGGFTNPTGTYQVPTNIATQPSYFANYAQSTAPFQPFTPSQTFQPRPVETGQKQSYIPFNQLIPTVNARRETFEYRNAAGQKLFIPFINGQPIYPIPEGYRRYTEEQQTQTKQAPVTGTTTQVTGDNDSDVMSGTSQVTNIQDPDITDNQRAGIVMSALDKATDKGKLGKALGVLGTSMVPGIGLAGALAGQQLGFDPMAPDRTALDDVLGQYGYDAKAANAALNDPMASVGFTQQQAIDMANSVTQTEVSSNAMQEAIAQAMYGMSKAQATSMLGVPANTTLGIRGYKNGQVDPTTNATYAYGQAVDDDGNVSYGSIDDFGISMNAMGVTGFMGSLADVDRVMNSLTATQKQKNAAKKYKRIVTMKSKYGKDIDIDTISDKSFGDDSGPGPGDGGGATGDPDDDDSAATDTGTADATGTAGQAAAGSSQTDSGPGSDDNPDATDNSESGTGDAESMGDDGGMGPTAVGGLVNKRKPKPKKMKRGGLASKK